jgi:hypothetical protein
LLFVMASATARALPMVPPLPSPEEENTAHRALSSPMTDTITPASVAPRVVVTVVVTVGAEDVKGERGEEAASGCCCAALLLAAAMAAAEAAAPRPMRAPVHTVTKRGSISSGKGWEEEEEEEEEEEPLAPPTRGEEEGVENNCPRRSAAREAA